MKPLVTNPESVEFLRQPGLQRMWALVRKKYESYGRVAGTIRLPGLREEEREALEGLFAVNMLGRSEFKFHLSELERALKETKFRLSVLESLRLLNGEDWMTRQEQLETVRRSWERFCRWAAGFAVKEELKIWIKQVSAGSGGGYRVFLECYKEYRENGDSPEWAAALTALQQLPARNERLPVFSARTTGDPHGLDRSTLAGRIFYWGMLALQDRYRQESGSQNPDERESDPQNSNERESDEQESNERESNERESNEQESNERESNEQEADRIAPQEGDFEKDSPRTESDIFSDVVLESVSQSETIREQYRLAGIITDDISSIVWVAGWGDFAKDPVAMPLLTVERLDTTGFPPVAEMFVVENPSIFGTLLDRELQKATALPFPLVCTSGQPSLAGLRLLDKMTDERSRIYYNGDFDVKGLTMAIGLSQRYRNRFVPWRLDTGTYQAAVENRFPAFSEAEIQALERLQVSWDDQLVKAMRQSGKKVFQEQILDVLLADWEVKRMG